MHILQPDLGDIQLRGRRCYGYAVGRQCPVIVAVGRGDRVVSLVRYTGYADDVAHQQSVAFEGCLVRLVGPQILHDLVVDSCLEGHLHMMSLQCGGVVDGDSQDLSIDDNRVAGHIHVDRAARRVAEHTAVAGMVSAAACRCLCRFLRCHLSEILHDHFVA